MTLREIAYRLDADRAGDRLPMRLAADAPDLVVETTVAHLDDQGQVWRVLHAHGPEEQVARARDAFHAYAPPFLVEKQVLGDSPGRLVLWYRYREPRGKEGSSHTALAFRLLGRDTVVRDETRGGVLHVHILARSGTGLATFLDAVRRDGAEVLYTGPPRAPAAATLTDVEETTLRTAWAMGYYAVPRTATLQEVGRRLGVPATTAGYRLRRSEGKLVAAHMGEHQGP